MIPTNDIWVAALALEHDLPLYALDEHFERVAGLTGHPCATPRDVLHTIALNECIVEVTYRQPGDEPSIDLVKDTLRPRGSGKPWAIPRRSRTLRASNWWI